MPKPSDARLKSTSELPEVVQRRTFVHYFLDEDETIPLELTRREMEYAALQDLFLVLKLMIKGRFQSVPQPICRRWHPFGGLVPSCLTVTISTPRPSRLIRIKVLRQSERLRGLCLFLPVGSPSKEIRNSYLRRQDGPLRKVRLPIHWRNYGSSG